MAQDRSGQSLDAECEKCQRDHREINPGNAFSEPNQIQRLKILGLGIQQNRPF